MATPVLDLAVLLTGSRTSEPTFRQVNSDEWTLATAAILALMVGGLATVGLVVQFTDWSGGFLPTVYELLIHADAVVSTGTTAIWAPGRLYAFRTTGEAVL